MIGKSASILVVYFSTPIPYCWFSSISIKNIRRSDSFRPQVISQSRPLLKGRPVLFGVLFYRSYASKGLQGGPIFSFFLNIPPKFLYIPLVVPEPVRANENTIIILRSARNALSSFGK